jgi:hypothetical protein
MDANGIMALADTYADGPHTKGYFGFHRAALRAAALEEAAKVCELYDIDTQLAAAIRALC